MLKIIITIKKNLDKLTLTLNRIGSIYHEWGLYDVAMKYYLDALKLIDKKDSTASTEYGDRIAQTYNNLGLLYKDMGETEKAYDYFLHALNYYKKSDDTRLISYTMNNLGIVYKRIGEYKKALEYYTESLRLKKKLKDQRGISNSYGNIGDVYLLMNNLNEALKYYNDALQIMREKNDSYGIANTLHNIASIQIKKNNPDKAIDLLNEALPIAQKNTLKDIQKDIFNAYANAYEKKNDFQKSLYFQKRHHNLKDSILNENNSSKILELEIAYNSNQKQRENDILRLQSQQKEYELSEQLSFQYLLILIIVVFIFIGVLLFVRSKILHKSRKILSEKNQHIEKMNEELVSVNEELDNRVNDRTQALSIEMEEKEKILIKVQDSYKKAEEANLLKDAFLANINHEIRTPLSAIIGLAEVLKNKVPANNELQLNKYVDGIHQSGYRLLCLLNNILDISRVEANDFKINLAFANINKITLNATELFKFNINEKGLKLSMNLGKDTQAVADNDILSKVITDIIDNAVKYTQKGEIEISTGQNKNSSEVYIKISDTGIGIDEDYLPHVFETFRQESTGYARKYQGAGLGLPLAKRLLKLMNGRIEISSKKNKGSSVIIYLPSHIESISDSTSVSYESISIPSESLKNKGVEILLVEDDKFNALFLQTILESVGNVNLAYGGSDAIELIENFNKQNKTFDIVILDINLPEKWEGISLMKDIKQNYSNYVHVPFIAQSAYSLNSDRERILGEGFIEFLTKPIDSESLLNSVKKYLINKF